MGLEGPDEHAQTAVFIMAWSRWGLVGGRKAGHASAPPRPLLLGVTWLTEEGGVCPQGGGSGTRLILMLTKIWPHVSTRSEIRNSDAFSCCVVLAITMKKKEIKCLARRNYLSKYQLLNPAEMHVIKLKKEKSQMQRQHFSETFHFKELQLY